jgi:S-adenosyl-L-methionine hydrolase (adenosine-forming)
LNHRTISFLSDYGLVDEFVGVVHSVLRSIAPHAAVVDITHGIPRHDVRAGALCLARSAQYLCPGVVLAVVDPGVGTDRRAIAVEVGGGQSFLVGPDNGLLAPAVSMVGGADRAVALTNEQYQLAAPGPTFAGRDVFAPAAAHLASGVDIAELGDRVDPMSLLPGVLPVPSDTADGLAAEVLWVDTYGNVQLNVGPDDIEGWGDRVGLRWGDNRRTAKVVDTYELLNGGDVGLVVDSYGLESVVVPRGSAAALLGLAAGDEIHLVRYDDDAPAPSITTPVELQRRR